MVNWSFGWLIGRLVGSFSLPSEPTCEAVASGQEGLGSIPDRAHLEIMEKVDHSQEVTLHRDCKIKPAITGCQRSSRKRTDFECTL